MNISLYLNEIRRRINKINSYVSNPMHYQGLNNPFASTLPQTYVWIEEEKPN